MLRGRSVSFQIHRSNGEAMRNIGKMVFVVLVSFSLISLVPMDAFARKIATGGRGEGMASVQVKAKNSAEVASAIKSVFGEDGYQLKQEWDDALYFARAAGRFKDISYGGAVSSGMWEQVAIDIHDNGSGHYRIECNVYMTEGDQVPDVNATKVMKVFGGEYRKMLKRVKDQLP
jgi:hypothetical protein